MHSGAKRTSGQAEKKMRIHRQPGRGFEKEKIGKEKKTHQQRRRRRRRGERREQREQKSWSVFLIFLNFDE